MGKRPKPFAPPTSEEREQARAAATALQTAIANPSMMGAPQSMHVDYSRPRRGVWLTTWPGLPGFVRSNGRYSHALLPGWEYARREVAAEMIPDLEALAERGVRPTEATTIFLSQPVQAGSAELKLRHG